MSGVMKVDSAHLSAAVGALGDIMLEMQRRKLLASSGANAAARRLLEAKALTDEQVGDLAAMAFEAGATELARVGHPGTMVHVCNPSEGPR